MTPICSPSRSSASARFTVDVDRRPLLDAIAMTRVVGESEIAFLDARPQARHERRLLRGHHVEAEPYAGDAGHLAHEPRDLLLERVAQRAARHRQGDRD